MLPYFKLFFYSKNISKCILILFIPVVLYIESKQDLLALPFWGWSNKLIDIKMVWDFATKTVGLVKNYEE